MKIYYEYDAEDYYGLVVVETKGTKYYRDKADEIYHHYLGDHDVGVTETEYNPTEVSKEYAFWMFANCEGVEHMALNEALKEFNSFENTCVVIDGSLI